MKLTPLLDLWQKPDGAGDPTGVLATTFTLDPDFFERNCLARFLAVESVDEDTGSAEDLVAQLELEDGLLAPTVTVLADRTAQVERSTLRWDLLACQIDGGLLHAKVALLLWERATRVIIGSANLTPAGYRHNIELAMAADLGSGCIFPRPVLDAIADELESYLGLVPGLDEAVPASQKAHELLRLFRDRIATQTTARTKLAVALAPTNSATQPLNHFREVWRGAQPLEATHVSPYWDVDDAIVLKTIDSMLTGQPATARCHRVAVTIGPGGETTFPRRYVDARRVDDVVQLGPLDDNIRPLHAKCLVVQSMQWVAVLVGSSNHTAAGLGLGGGFRHREINLWLGAPIDSAEGKALSNLLPHGSPVDLDAPYEAPDDEDEPDEFTALPGFFQLCRLAKNGKRWDLQLTFDTSSAPSAWSVYLPSRHLVINDSTWTASGAPTSFVVDLDAEWLPMFLDVEWDGGDKATWPVIADDRHVLPPKALLSDLRSSQLLDALATGKSLARALHEKESVHETQERAVGLSGIVTDPLKRFDSRSTLLHRGRALAAALAGLQRRLTYPVVTLDALKARLSGPLGPQYVAARVVADQRAGELSGAEAMFTLAEIALSVGRVSWPTLLELIDRSEGLALVQRALDEIDDLLDEIRTDSGDIADYTIRAIKEARRCLTC